MQITKNSLETTPGPSDWFSGAVYIDAVATPSEPSRVQAASVHFTPGARTAWHTHPFGQTIYVTEGVGRCQGRGGPIEVIRPGDRVFFGAGEDHWHGAAPTRFMTHLAMQEVDDQGSPVTWGDHVTDEEYAGVEAVTDSSAYVVEAELALGDGLDPAAVGAAVTVELCGHWEHEGACRWPHNSAIDAQRDPARFRTLFVADESESAVVRERVEATLRRAAGWRVVSIRSRPVAKTERPLAERLLAGPRAAE